jgi:site-specific recombinase XerC
MAQQQHKGWKDELQALINEHNAIRVNGKVTSHKTQSDRAKCLFKFFNDLRDKGYAASPRNIKLKHIKLICEKYEQDGLSAATIQTYLMHLRVFCRWIGKDGMIGNAEQYFTDPSKVKRSYAATELKTWTDKGIDISQKLNEIKQDNVYVWIQLLMQQGFGLRLKEALRIRPYMHAIEGNLHVVDGAKGGKSRIVPIESDFQEYIIATAKQFVGKTSNSLMDQKLTLPQNMKKYSNLMTKHGMTKKDAGVTGHWLRAEYVIDFMVSRGLVPLVKGGEVGQLPKEQELEIRLEASQRLGHNRVGITTAYSGAFTETGKKRSKKDSAAKGKED